MSIKILENGCDTNGLISFPFDIYGQRGSSKVFNLPIAYNGDYFIIPLNDNIAIGRSKKLTIELVFKKNILIKKNAKILKIVPYQKINANFEKINYITLPKNHYILYSKINKIDDLRLSIEEFDSLPDEDKKYYCNIYDDLIKSTI